MYIIHYVVGRESNQPTDKETSDATDLATAIATAKQKIKNSNIAIRWDSANPHPTGFLIFDVFGIDLLHREYLA